MTGLVAAHTQLVTHRYLLTYPEHGPRRADPHYVDFEAYRKRTKGSAVCTFAVATGVIGECAGGLELHHSHVEYAMLNAVDFASLERRYPGISDPTTVGAWVESADNLEWLCVWHHRGHGGKHSAAAADYEAQAYIRDLIR